MGLLIIITGKGILELGDVGPELAHAMKLVGNLVIISQIETIAESMTLAEKSGISRDVVLEFFSKVSANIRTHEEPCCTCMLCRIDSFACLLQLFPSPITLGYANRIAHDDLSAAVNN